MSCSHWFGNICQLPRNSHFILFFIYLFIFWHKRKVNLIARRTEVEDKNPPQPQAAWGEDKTKPEPRARGQAPRPCNSHWNVTPKKQNKNTKKNKQQKNHFHTNSDVWNASIDFFDIPGTFHGHRLRSTGLGNSAMKSVKSTSPIAPFTLRPIIFQNVLTTCGGGKINGTA